MRKCINCKNPLTADCTYKHCEQCLDGATYKPEFTDLTLNNGKIAKFIRVDSWARPRYEITLDNGNVVEVCCINLNGTYLHTMSGGEDPEPESPVKQDYQPINS